MLFCSLSFRLQSISFAISPNLPSFCCYPLPRLIFLFCSSLSGFTYCYHRLFVTHCAFPVFILFSFICSTNSCWIMTHLQSLIATYLFHRSHRVDQSHQNQLVLIALPTGRPVAHFKFLILLHPFAKLYNNLSESSQLHNIAPSKFVQTYLPF